MKKSIQVISTLAIAISALTTVVESEPEALITLAQTTTEAPTSSITKAIDNNQEWSVMQAKFAGNLYSPTTQDDIPVINTQKLAMKLDYLETLVQYGRATKSEYHEYLALKINFLSDRLELLEYYHQRLEKMTIDQSIQLIAALDITQGHQVAEQLKIEISQLQTELKAI